MKINTNKLKNALEQVQPGLANKELIEQSTSFAFMDGQIITYNDEISISHPVKELETIKGAVKADELYRLLSKIKKEEVEILLEENEILIKSGRMKAGLKLQHEIKLPLEEIGKVGKWKDLPNDFVKALRFTMGVCSPDMSRPILTCVHVSKEGHVEASDSQRIARYELENVPITFLIPATSTAELVKLNPIKIAQGQGWVHFQTKDNTIISCRVYDEEFVKVEQYLKMEGGIELTLPKSTDGVLEKARVFSKRDHLLDENVVITLQDKRMKIQAESESGRFEEEMNIRYDEEPISFTIIPYLLEDILSETNVCLLCEDRLKFEGENWQYVTALLGMKD